jgi:hypothetical protein
MNEWEFLTLLVEKFGVPGVVLGGIGWAMYRFGFKPNGGEVVVNETAQAINGLAAKMEDFKIEVTDKIARLETNVENLKGRGR